MMAVVPVLLWNPFVLYLTRKYTSTSKIDHGIPTNAIYSTILSSSHFFQFSNFKVKQVWKLTPNFLVRAAFCPRISPLIPGKLFYYIY